LGGLLGEAGSVGWQFKRAAYFTVPLGNKSFDSIFELAVDGGADDVNQDGDSVEIIAPVESFKTIVDKLRAANILPDEAGLRMLPTQEIELNVEDTLQVLRAIDTIEEMDDVQNVFSNLHISDEAMAAMEEE
jgi:transcriptional/translational regulatory protein YebC/TACO1